MKNRDYLAIAMISASFIAFEIIWTRVISAEFFYTFAFLIISLAFLGLGLGALALRLIKPFNKDGALPILISLSAIFAVVSPALSVNLGIKFPGIFTNWVMPLKLLSAVILLFLPYFFGGIAIASLFKRAKENFHKLYAFDLIGASIGAALAVFLTNAIGVAPSAFICALPLAASAFLYSNRTKYIAAIAIILVVILLPKADNYLTSNREERAEVIYKNWDAMGLIKIYKDDSLCYGINIDNAANSPVYKFDGNFNKPDSEKIEFAINLKNFISANQNCSFVDIGSGGGTGVLQALQCGVKKATALEVIPEINRLLVKGELKDFSGNIYNDPRVEVHSEDARLFIRSSKENYDLMFSASSNTFAALGSGAFAMAENYLFTKEAIKDYYNKLSSNGFFIMEHQFYVPRVFAGAIEALRESKVENPEKKIAVYNLPQMRRKILVIAKKDLTGEFLDTAFYKLSSETSKFINLAYPNKDKSNIFNKIIDSGWRSAQDSIAIDISPTTDDRPFSAQLGLIKNLWNKELYGKIMAFEYNGFPIAKLIIIFCLIASILVSLPIIALPYFQKNERKLSAREILYFFSIGVAFISIEIILIQRYALIIGASAYSFVAIVLGMLLSGGLGSLRSEKMSINKVFLFIAFFITLEIIALRPILMLISGLPMTLRFIASAMFVAPLGYFMGMPFSIGAKRVGELVDWGFAINGVSSVIGSCAALLIAFNYGYNSALFFGAFFYFAAFLSIRSTKEKKVFSE